MKWWVVVVAAGVALGVMVMVVALVQERVNQRLASAERRLRYLEDNVVWSGDNKGLSVEGQKHRTYRIEGRNGRCKRGL